MLSSRPLAQAQPTAAAAPGKPERSEVTIAYLMAGVQFVNVLDFMMVNPLGPQFSEALGVQTSSGLSETPV